MTSESVNANTNTSILLLVETNFAESDANIMQCSSCINKFSF